MKPVYDSKGLLRGVDSGNTEGGGQQAVGGCGGQWSTKREKKQDPAGGTKGRRARRLEVPEGPKKKLKRSGSTGLSISECAGEN